jgi:hypothetical protein
MEPNLCVNLTCEHHTIRYKPVTLFVSAISRDVVVVVDRKRNYSPIYSGPTLRFFHLASEVVMAWVALNSRPAEVTAVSIVSRRC